MGGTPPPITPLRWLQILYNKHFVFPIFLFELFLFDTLRMLMSIIAAEDLEAIQMDIKTAFLNGPLEEEIFM